MQLAPGPQSAEVAQGRRQVPALQVQPLAQSVLALQCCAGWVVWGVTDPILVPLGVAAGGFCDMFLGEQKLPAGLMVHASVELQSASEWQPGQQPMVVQTVPAPHWALVVHGG
jgi:hypothetical protein